MRTVEGIRFCLLAALGVAAAWGFDFDRTGRTPYRVAWAPGFIEMHVEMPTSPTYSDGSNPSSAIVAALQTWNSHLGQVQFTPNIQPAGTQIFRNETSEVVMADRISGTVFGPYTLAVAVSRDQGDVRTESDVIFNTAWNWDSYRGDLQDGKEDIRRVALHEFGHTLGLLHPDQADPPQGVEALMNSVVSDLDGLQADDIAGAQWLYGARGFEPTNDDFSAAELITHHEHATTLFGTNIAADTETGEPSHAGVERGSSVWWRWIAPEDGSLTVDTSGSNFDTVLAVYRGAVFETLTKIADNDDERGKRTSSIKFIFEQGLTYYFAVDGWDKMQGRINLNLSPVLPAGTPEFINEPSTAYVLVGAPATFTAEITGAEPMELQWQENSTGEWLALIEGGDFSGVNTTSLTVSGESALDEETLYRLRVANSVDTVTSEEVGLVPSLGQPELMDFVEFIEVTQGEAIELTVTAAGDYTFEYEWYNANGLIEGESGSSVRIDSALVTDAGIYRVRVTSSMGSLYSPWIRVVVQPGPPSGIVRLAAGDRQSLYLRADGWVMGAGANDRGLLGFAVGINGEILNTTALWSDAADVHISRLWSGIQRPDGSIMTVDPADSEQLTVVLQQAMHVWVEGNDLYAVGNDGTLRRFTKSFGLQELAEHIESSGYGDEFYFIDANSQLWRMGRWESERLLVSENVVKVSGETNRAVLLRSDGSAAYARVIGSGSSARIGMEEVSLDNIVDVAGGEFHTLFLTSDGILWAAGDNTHGQLGDGTTEARTNPVQIADRVWTMAAGKEHSLFVREDGSAWAMGRGLGSSFGDGSSDGSLFPRKIYEGPISSPVSPQSVVATSDVTDLVRVVWAGAIGATFYEVWRSDSDDIEDAILLRSRVDGTLIYDADVIPGKNYHYWVRAVNQAGPSPFSSSVRGKTEGEVPQFGSIPEVIRTLVDGHVIVTIEATGPPAPDFRWQVRHATSDEWVDLQDSQLIRGADSNRLRIIQLDSAWAGSRLRVIAENSIGATVSESILIDLEEPRGVTAAAAGESHIVYVTDDGWAWTRGSDGAGELGNGPAEVETRPSRIMDDVVAVDAAHRDTLFLRSDGALWGTGRAGAGRYGPDHPLEVDVPVFITDEVIWAELGWTYLIFINREGELWISGRNIAQEDPRATPDGEMLKIADNVLSASAAVGHFVYITSDHKLWAAGTQRYGRLANGVDDVSHIGSPYLVAEDVVAGAAGSEATYFVKRDGTLWGAGSNPDGIMGDTGGDPVLRPVLIANNAVDVDADRFHVVYRKSNGEVWALGRNEWGAAGSTPSAGIPTAMIHPNPVLFVTGLVNTLFVDEEATLWGIGSNLYNQIGTSGTVGPIQTTGGSISPSITALDVEASSDESNRHIRLSWIRKVGDVAYSIWRNTRDDFSTATLLAEGHLESIFYDYSARGDFNYNYWVVAELQTGAARLPAEATGRRLRRTDMSLSVEAADLTVARQTVSVSIGSDTVWTVTHNVTWVQISTSEGEGNEVLEITVEYNDTAAERSGTISINERDIIITQQANVSQAPEFLVEPSNQVAFSGSNVVLSTATLGLPPPTFQWFRDGEIISGADESTLSLHNITEADEGIYTVEATNSFGSAMSGGARVTLYDANAGVVATHRIISDTPIPGGEVVLENEVSFPAGLEYLHWTSLLPEGWQFASSDNDQDALIRPVPENASLAEWEWVRPDSSPLIFRYTLHVSAHSRDQSNLSAFIESRQSGDSSAVLATPDPLNIPIRPPTHSADTNGDSRLGLSELLRVIELYNTRFGTSRTGRYGISSSSEDGFQPISTGTGSAILERYHSADIDKSGSLSLSELLRVIELYNTREGSVRTGAYRASVQTEDGFAPDS